ncbi:MAG TPA: hypothetical protein VJQ83_02550, partial [Tepidiformaceae bacterium]|nr:hypothetical protein [Tepidiformaceae bacterium]
MAESPIRATAAASVADGLSDADAVPLPVTGGRGPVPSTPCPPDGGRTLPTPEGGGVELGPMPVPVGVIVGVDVLVGDIVPVGVIVGVSVPVGVIVGVMVPVGVMVGV